MGSPFPLHKGGSRFFLCVWAPPHACPLLFLLSTTWAHAATSDSMVTMTACGPLDTAHIVTTSLPICLGMTAIAVLDGVSFSRCEPYWYQINTLAMWGLYVADPWLHLIPGLFLNTFMRSCLSAGLHTLNVKQLKELFSFVNSSTYCIAQRAPQCLASGTSAHFSGLAVRPRAAEVLAC